jgi:hypothetical protein
MKTQMLLDELSTEFIIASKSHDALSNILEVYKGHYDDYNRNSSLNALVEILSPIVQSVKEVRLQKILSDLLPVNRWKSGSVGFSEDTPFNEIIVRNLISEMRMIDRDKLFVISQETKDLSLQDFIVEYVIPSMKVLTQEHFPNPDHG